MRIVWQTVTANRITIEILGKKVKKGNASIVLGVTWLKLYSKCSAKAR